MTYLATNATELVDYGRQGADVDYSRIIQGFHRFLVDLMALESGIHGNIKFDSTSHNSLMTPVTQLMGLELSTVTKCFNCKAVREKTNVLHVVDMVYPRRASYVPLTTSKTL